MLLFMQEAEKSLRFYRNIGKNSSKEKEEWFLQEFNKFKSTYQKETKPTDADSKITLKDFGTNHSLLLHS